MAAEGGLSTAAGRRGAPDLGGGARRIYLRRSGRAMVASRMGLLGYALILVLFATWFTAHALLCWQLATRSSTQALIGFVVFPLCPYWGRQEGFKRLTFVWLGSLMLYGLSLLQGLL